MMDRAQRRIRLKFDIIVDRLLSTLTETETSLAEFWGSTMLMTAGFWLLLPWETFSWTPAYRLMASIAPEPAWGIVGLAVGGYQSAANVAHSRSHQRRSAFVASVFCAFIFSLALVSGPFSLLTPTWGTASLLQGIVYLRLSLDGRGDAGNT